jgi:hypothetical protein
MLKTRLFFLAMTAAGMPLVTIYAFAADPGTCKFYAKDAVADFNNGTYGANQDRCKIHQDGRWNADYQHHYNWCLSAPDTARISEQSARKDFLNKCLSSTL